MGAKEGESLGPPKKRIWLPPKRKKRSIYSHHNRSGSQKGNDTKAPNTGDAAPVAAEDTNDIKLEIA